MTSFQVGELGARLRLPVGPRNERHQIATPIKRHLARRTWHLLQPPPPDLTNSPNIDLFT
jgi:hypothetical protein